MNTQTLPKPALRPRGKLNFVRFTARFAAPLWRFYLAGFFLLAVVNYINLVVPQLAKRIVNELPTATIDQAPPLLNTALSVIGLGLLVVIVRALSRIAIFWPGRRLETDAKDHFFGRMLRLPEAFFMRHGMGDLISRLANDLGQLRAFYAFGVLQAANVVFLTVMTITQMAAVHATLTVLVLIPLLSMLVITYFAMPRMHRWSKLNQEALGALSNRVTEAFVHVHVIQANAVAPGFIARAASWNEKVYESNIKLIFIRTLVFPMMSLLAGLSQLVVLYYGGHEVMAGRLTVGDILSFNIYIGLLTFPLTALGMILSMYQRAQAALERLGDIDAAEVEAPRVELLSQAPAEPRESPALLELKNLHFSYPTTAPCEAPAAAETFRLSEIDLCVAPGQKIGLFGPIGSGKSTLFNLMTRLFDPPAGTIFWQGQDVLTWDPPALRQHIAYALQTVHLFSDSIRANLLFGLTEDVPFEKLREAADAAQILGEIEGFAEGWDTQIGEKGLRLSGGQKQRLALARLFLRDAKLFLLDDVLSAVDHTTERRLAERFDRLGAAVIISSHRGQSLRRCDEILILDDGRVVDRGRFETLITRHPALAGTL